MKKKMADKTAFVGAGVGVALFAVFGLQPGAFAGGLFGLNIARLFTGAEAVPTLIARVLVAGGMVAGVLAAAVVFTVTVAALGWAAGRALDYIYGGGRGREAEAARAL